MLASALYARIGLHSGPQSALAGDWYWTEHSLFPDYLREYPATAREYARLKHEVVARFRDDREAYTAAKMKFVTAVVERAKSSQK